jgi:hypothetical protein
MVEPVDPFERGVLDGLEAAPGSAPVDRLGFVETFDRFSQAPSQAQYRIVVAVADTADRWLDAGLREALSVPDRHVLGGFNRSSQRVLCLSVQGIGQAPRLGFSSPVSCVACH